MIERLERFPFLRRHDGCYWGALTTATALTPVTFVFTHGIALQVLGNSKALTSTAKRRMIGAAGAFPFPPTARRLLLGRLNDGNGSSSGHVRIYAWNSATSAWEQQGADIDGEAADDQSGYSVSLSSDGTTVAIGALITTATALTPVTFVFTHGIALQVLGNSKALTSTAKRRMIIAAIAFPFPPTARRLLLGRS